MGYIILRPSDWCEGTVVAETGTAGWFYYNFLNSNIILVEEQEFKCRRTAFLHTIAIVIKTPIGLIDLSCFVPNSEAMNHKTTLHTNSELYNIEGELEIFKFKMISEHNAPAQAVFLPNNKCVLSQLV